MEKCDMCGLRKSTMAVCQPCPSDPTELCSIMYVCDKCGGDSVTSLDQLIEVMKAGKKFAASFQLFRVLEMSGRLDETGFMWLSI